MVQVPHRVGIAAIATYQPPWLLRNEWFGETMPRKFVHHTGIEARPIAREDEVSLAIRATHNLQRETGCNLADCAGVIFVSPSFVPKQAARRFLDESQLRRESLRQAARQLASRLRLPRCPVLGINWFCSGYSRGLEIALHRLVPRIDLGPQQFVLVITSSRISRITDYSCKQTGALFGDLATVTLLARTDSRKYPVHFELLHAHAQKAPAEGVYFDFHWRDNIPIPTEAGGQDCDPRRLVFSLDGMGIADVAPRAMAGSLITALRAAEVALDDVRFVIPHQAGKAIVRLAAMKIEAAGIRGEVINGQTTHVGNVSSGSIPLAIKNLWSRLSGTIACPTAAVGEPGKAEVSQGCVLLRATATHERMARAA